MRAMLKSSSRLLCAPYIDPLLLQARRQQSSDLFILLRKYQKLTCLLLQARPPWPLRERYQSSESKRLPHTYTHTHHPPIPPPQLVAHVSANKVILRRWEEGSVREWSAISYPNQVGPQLRRQGQGPVCAGKARGQGVPAKPGSRLRLTY